MANSLNLDGVQHERARKVVDTRFAAKVHDLDECFYGERGPTGAFKRDGKSGWKYGHSAPFQGFDVLTSSLPDGLKVELGVAEGQEVLDEKQATRLFNMLNGAMQSAYTVALIKANRNLDEPHDENNINPVYDASKDRRFKLALKRRDAEFERQLREQGESLTTFGQLVALYNSIPVTTDGADDEPMGMQSKAQRALNNVRKFEDLTGIKVRSIVGTLPER